MRDFSKLKNAADAVLIFSPENRFYFTKFESTFGILLLCDKPVFFTDSRYSEEAEATIDSGIEVVAADSSDVYFSLLEKIKSLGIKKLGIEYGFLTLKWFEDYKELFKEYEFTDVSDILYEMRSVKADDEIEAITFAQNVTDKVFKQVLNEFKQGVTEKDIANELEYLIRKQGCGLAFPSIVAFDTDTSRPHAHPSDKKLVKDSVILMDFGAKYKGYCSDMTRTFYFGKPPQEFKSCYNIVLNAQKNALSKLQAGLLTSEADALSREYFVSQGMDKYFTHSLGHGVGIEIHEPPALRSGGKELLQPDMVVTVEPGLYFAGEYGIRIEDLVVIKEGEIVNLTSSNKKILTL